jgi:hypothetical protein
MYGGTARGRVASWTDGPRRGRLRAGVGAATVAVLAAALMTGGREPSQALLATAPLSLAGPAPSATPAGPPVHLPAPTGRQMRQPASASRTATLAAPIAAAGVPAVALAAYQRSAAVIDAADPSCRLDWSLLGAIGQIESDHGRFGGSGLDRHGVARPAIIGPRLDGRHGTSLVRDTDAGRLDGDRRFDRAVGPMQFLPSTWAAVAVDGDDDGRRDVQDIDDASLGSAVYLCADHDDLSTRAGERAAVFRYNHSRAYVAHVLTIAHELRISVVVPSTELDVRSVAFIGPQHRERLSAPGIREHARVRSGHPRHEQVTAPAPQSTQPSGPAQGDPTPPSGPDPSPSPEPTPPPTPAPTPDPTPDPTPAPTPDPVPTPTPGPSDAPVLPSPLPAELSELTPAQVDAFDAAWVACDDDLVVGWSSAPATVDALSACLADHAGVPSDDPGLLAFLAWLGRTQDPPTP